MYIYIYIFMLIYMYIYIYMYLYIYIHVYRYAPCRVKRDGVCQAFLEVTETTLERTTRTQNSKIKLEHKLQKLKSNATLESRTRIQNR